MQRPTCWLLLILLMLACPFAQRAVAAEETINQKCVLSVERIWDRAGHSAFTDLVQFRGAWYCSFREASGHIPGFNGLIRVIRSRDQANWESVALLDEEHVDLRDPKLSVTPDGRLMVNSGASYYQDTHRQKIESRAAFSDTEGNSFGPPRKMVFPKKIVTGFDWLWRVTWHDGWAWGAIQQIPNEGKRHLQLVRSKDGVTWDHVCEMPQPVPSETTLRFRADGSLVAMIRDSAKPSPGGRIGHARPPYTEWKFLDTPKSFGGPNFVELPGGVFLAGSRDRGEKGAVTALWGLDPDAGVIRDFLVLPSGGDNSYPGIVVDEPNGRIVISYYSGHEGKSAIYLATLRLDAVTEALKKLAAEK